MNSKFLFKILLLPIHDEIDFNSCPVMLSDKNSIIKTFQFFPLSFKSIIGFLIGILHADGDLGRWAHSICVFLRKHVTCEFFAQLMADVNYNEEFTNAVIENLEDLREKRSIPIYDARILKSWEILCRRKLKRFPWFLIRLGTAMTVAEEDSLVYLLRRMEGREEVSIFLHYSHGNSIPVNNRVVEAISKLG